MVLTKDVLVGVKREETRLEPFIKIDEHELEKQCFFSRILEMKGRLEIG